MQKYVDENSYFLYPLSSFFMIAFPSLHSPPPTPKESKRNCGSQKVFSLMPLSPSRGCVGFTLAKVTAWRVFWGSVEHDTLSRTPPCLAELFCGGAETAWVTGRCTWEAFQRPSVSLVSTRGLFSFVWNRVHSLASACLIGNSLCNPGCLELTIHLLPKCWDCQYVSQHLAIEVKILN